MINRPGKLHFIIWCIVTILFIKLEAQVDTIFIYDTIFEYDTIYRTIDKIPVKLKSIDNPLFTHGSKIDLKNISIIIHNKSATIFIDSIILSENDNKNYSMKKNAIAGIALALIQGISYGQEDSIKFISKPENQFNIFLKLSLATQIHSYPNVQNYDNVQKTTDDGINRNFLSEEEFGKYGEQFLPAFGMGANYQYYLNNWFSIKPQINYIQKGCTYRGKVIYEFYPDGYGYSVGSEGSRFNYNNRFHYLSFDLLLNFHINIKKWNKIIPYFTTGYRNDILLYYTIGYDIDDFSESNHTLHPGRDDIFDTSYPLRSNYKNFNRYNNGMVNNFGLAFQKGWFVELGMNFDFGYVVKNSDLKVRNWVSFLNIGFKL